MTPFEYAGTVYIRPLGRGIWLEEDPVDRDLDDAIEQWLRASGRAVSPSAGARVRLRIHVEMVDGAPGEGA